MAGEHATGNGSEELGGGGAPAGSRGTKRSRVMEALYERAVCTDERWELR